MLAQSAATWHHEHVATDLPTDGVDHLQQTRAAYDRLATVWSAATDDGPFNGHLERPALRALVPPDLAGATVMDAGCGSGAQAEWLLDQGADVVAFDLSPAMVGEARRRCRGRGRFFIADLGGTLPVEPRSVDGVTCSLAMHYVADWNVPLRSFARVLRPGGWMVLSTGHPFAPPLVAQHGGYFDTELVSETWRKAHVEVTQHFWRRPLSADINAFADAGFVVDRIAEPQTSCDALHRFPDELERLVGVPIFIVYRLRLADTS